MGVPKFFRWLSERYPAISQVIAENRIPEFDCLYLDMNGIIHNCTHKDPSEDTTFRISEDEMFIRIFNYIEHLFGKIKPKQLFFMAIDGVAPRAKMNQQRSRRFRSALDAEKARDKAKREGVKLPQEPPFDSNCITPGTEFMAKLSLQLRYFVNKKVSEDADWQQCEIVLSGHEVPGEGEHKIMEYIRCAKAQPGYNPNVRHCLYGLDADLIMLGLLSHDPHFCLLREEVTFGRASKTKSKELEHQNFYLLHLCIVREYLELEFQHLKKDGVLTFAFNLERVIDDFILMAFFVGNDFLPNLPHLHINDGALAQMFDIYKTILPACDGYINEDGVINLPRLKLLLDELSKNEVFHFEDSIDNEKWFQSKKLETRLPERGKTSKGRLVITSGQRELWKKQIKPFISNHVDRELDRELDLGHQLKAADRKFVQDITDKLRLQWTTKDDESGNRHLIVTFPTNKPAMGAQKAMDAYHAAQGLASEDKEEEEGDLAAFRVMKTYDNALVVDVTPEDAEKHYQKQYDDHYLAWKTRYYVDKFEWPLDVYDAQLTKLCENYVQGLQWVLHYYYSGIASWPWFYASHYSPMISDVVKGLGVNLDFKLGEPFKPFEQLMGVLPDRSKTIVPEIYWELMTDPNSPIIDFYPRDFELDMNGKKMEWEAVVKIPFIDEKRLLAAMSPKNEQLTEAEKIRNGYGVPLKFVYSSDISFEYPSPLPGIFPNVPQCHCIENIFDLPAIEGLEYRVGLMDGVKLNAEALAGFPTLQTLSHSASLIEGYGVNVFQSDSRSPSMIVNLAQSDARTKIEANKVKLGRRCFVGYPFLQEGRIVKVSDELFDYELAENGRSANQKAHSTQQISDFSKESHYIESWYAKRLGISIGTVESLVQVDILKGLVKTEEGALIKEYGPNPSMRSVYAAQTVVDEVVNEDERFIERSAVPIEEEFPIGTKAFFLGAYAFGRPLEVTGYEINKLTVLVSQLQRKEPEFTRQIIAEASRSNRYQPSFAVAKSLSLHPLLLSKIMSSFQITTMGGQRVNLGLNLKFDSRRQKVLDYSRKSDSGWEFSEKAIRLLATYMTGFPDLFAKLNGMPLKSDVRETNIWPEPAAASQRVSAIVSWLKEQETGKFERVPLEAEQLDSSVVMQLAAAGEKILADARLDVVTPLHGVPRSGVLKPIDAEMVLANQKFNVGDRVTFAASAGKVPLASRGTVVGISQTASLLLDVVWDSPFMNGITLGERAPPFRGQTVPSFTVINTSKSQVLADSRAAVHRREVRVVSSLTTSSYGMGSGPLYQDAQPPDPTKGPWRGANGRNRASSTRAGGNASPLRLVDSQDFYRHTDNQQQHYTGVTHSRSPARGRLFPPARGSPFTLATRGSRPGRFQPGGGGRYSNVPPPPSLQTPTGHGGRGQNSRGGRVSGGRGQGRSPRRQENATSG